MPHGLRNLSRDPALLSALCVYPTKEKNEPGRYRVIAVAGCWSLLTLILLRSDRLGNLVSTPATP